MTVWRPRSHFFLHRIINLPNSTAASKMPRPRFLVFLGTSLGSPSGMTRVKVRRKERWHFGNLQERGDKEARPKQQWIWIDEERMGMSTQWLCHLRALSIHIPLPLRSEIRQGAAKEARCLRCTLSVGPLEDQRIQVQKERTSYRFQSWYRIGYFLLGLTLWS